MRQSQQVVEVPLERAIYTPVTAMVQEMTRLAPVDAFSSLKAFASRLERYAMARARELHRRVEEDYEQFASDSSDVNPMTTKAGDGNNNNRSHAIARSGTMQTSVDLARKANTQVTEDAFMQRLHSVMTQSNYSLLTEAEYQQALNESYLLNVKLKMNTAALDDSVTARLLESIKRDEEEKRRQGRGDGSSSGNGGGGGGGGDGTAHSRPGSPSKLPTQHDSALDAEEPASINRFCLVYHRGLSSDSSEGWFLLEKIDALVGLVLSSVFWLVLFLLWPPMWFKRRGRRVTFADKTQTLEAGAEPPRKAATHKVIRRSLGHLMRESPLNLFRSCRLQEPCFRNLVIVYRRKEQLKTKTAKGLAPITLKAFSNVPIADLEVVFPEQHPRFRILDAASLVATIATAAAAAVYEFNQLEREQGVGEVTPDEVFFEMWPLLAVLSTYVVKIFVQYQSAEAYYQQMMQEYLYNRAQSTNFSLLASLIDQTGKQEYKEMLLAYFHLWHLGKQSLEELDDACEAFLRRLGEKNDFEVDDAVEKLVATGLAYVVAVEEASDSETGREVIHLQALPIEQASDQLKSLWNRLGDGRVDDLDGIATANAETPDEDAPKRQRTKRFLRRMFGRRQTSNSSRASRVGSSASTRDPTYDNLRLGPIKGSVMRHSGSEVDVAARTSTDASDSGRGDEDDVYGSAGNLSGMLASGPGTPVSEPRQSQPARQESKDTKGGMPGQKSDAADDIKVTEAKRGTGRWRGRNKNRSKSNSDTTNETSEAADAKQQQHQQRHHHHLFPHFLGRRKAATAAQPATSVTADASTVPTTSL